MLFVWLLVLAPIVIWLVREYRRNAAIAWVATHTRRPLALNLLRERYVRGELSRDEFALRALHLD